VLDLLVARSQSHETILLKGNHEVLLDEFLRKPESFATWRDVGGIDTLLSYGIRPPSNPGPAEQMMLGVGMTVRDQLEALSAIAGICTLSAGMARLSAC
jgi:hypothetical protein